MNEFTPFLCGAQVDLTMYSTTAYHVTGEDEIAMTPEYPVEEATYAVYPALPEGVTLNEATGAIAGATAHFRHFSSYTVIRSVAGAKTKFFFTVASGEHPSFPSPVDKEDPTPAPTTLPPTAAPTMAPTTAPTTAPTSVNWVVIGMAIAIVVIVVLVIVLVCCCRKGKKELPTTGAAMPQI